jgi:stage II sporulation protein D
MFRPIRSIKRSLVPVATLVLGLALVLPNSAFAADQVFKGTGKGWGHGIGMSQYGARGYARHGFTYDNILKHYYTGTTLGTLGSEPTVKVAIATSGGTKVEQVENYWSFRASDAPLWVDYQGRTGDNYVKLQQGIMYTFCSVNSANDALQIRHESTSGNLVVDYTFAPGIDWVSAWERVTSETRFAWLVEVNQRTGPFQTKNLLYRGAMVLNRSTSNLDGWKLYNHVYLEDYVKGVTPREMGASWETEAVKAQSLAARSYAVAGGIGKAAGADGYDVLCNTYYQVYNGWGKFDYVEYNTRIRHGDDPYRPGTQGDWLSDPEVDATKLQTVTYAGKTIPTFFFSTSGGHTENIENIWYSSPPQPYYQGVVDEYEWDSGSPYTFAWPENLTYTAAELKARFGTLVPDDIVAVRIIERGVSGRAKSVKFYGADGSESIVSGSTFRSKLGLRDTFFEITGGSVRIEGESRYDTSVEISRRAFSSAECVVLVNGTAFADALTAATLAGSVPGGAPVLLTGADSLNAGAKQEIERLGASKVYVVGGQNVVANGVLDTLRSMPQLSAAPTSSVVRVSGTTRYDTAAAVAGEVGTLLGDDFDGRVLFVNGEKYADAVAAAGFAYASRVPIVLTVWSNLYFVSGETLVDALSGGPLVGGDMAPMLFVRAASVPPQTLSCLTSHKSAVIDRLLLGGVNAISSQVQLTIEAVR